MVQKEVKREVARLVDQFDEIQACPRALTSLKYFCEDVPGLPICAAESARTGPLDLGPEYDSIEPVITLNR